MSDEFIQRMQIEQTIRKMKHDAEYAKEEETIIHLREITNLSEVISLPVRFLWWTWCPMCGRRIRKRMHDFELHKVSYNYFYCQCGYERALLIIENQK